MISPNTGSFTSDNRFRMSVSVASKSTLVMYSSLPSTLTMVSEWRRSAVYAGLSRVFLLPGSDNFTRSVCSSSSFRPLAEQAA